MDELDYEREDIVNLAKHSLDFLSALALPLVVSFFFPPLYQAAWEICTTKLMLEKDFSKVALGLPRGFAKTTLMKLLVLWIILFTDRKFILIVSSTATLAENFLADVVDMLQEENILRTFGDWRVELEKDTQQMKKFTFRGRTIIIAALGAGSSMRGLNLKFERPDVMLMEDIQTRECADSPIESQKLLQWMMGTLMKANSPKRCMYLFVANMYPTEHSILKKLNKNSLWIKFIVGGILSDGESLWPDLKSKQQLLEELQHDIEMGHPEIFFAEVLNDENAGLKAGVDIAAIPTCEFTFGIDIPQGRFIIIDPAGDNPLSDATTIGYFEVFDGKPVLVHLEEDKMSPGQTISIALHMAITRNCNLICVESAAYQASLLYWFDVIASQYHIQGINFCEITHGGKSKNSRIRAMFKQLPTKEVQMGREVRPRVVYQIAHFNPLRRDNVDGILDVLAYAPKVIELYWHIMEVREVVVDLDYENAKVRPTELTSAF